MLAPGDSGAVLAQQLAPTLYVQRDETFPLSRVVAVLHPRHRLIAYYLLWRDDVHGSWIPFTVPTDEEEVWVGYDATGAPTDLWTYWHGSVLHSDWRGKGQVLVDVQWGKHGSLPHGARGADLPRTKTLNVFYALTYLLEPDILLGTMTRPGPKCFCHGYGRYTDFSRVMPLASRLDAVARTENPDALLRAVFGVPYSQKPFWPWSGRAGRIGAAPPDVP